MEEAKSSVKAVRNLQCGPRRSMARSSLLRISITQPGARPGAGMAAARYLGCKQKLRSAVNDRLDAQGLVCRPEQIGRRSKVRASYPGASYEWSTKMATWFQSPRVF